MMYTQVEDINSLFKELGELKANAWVPKEEDPLKAPTQLSRENKSPRKVKPKVKVQKADKPRTNALQQLMAAGRKEVASLKVAVTVSENDLLTKPVTPRSALRPINKDKEKLFEGGFFSVRSPLRGSTSTTFENNAPQTLRFDNEDD